MNNILSYGYTFIYPFIIWQIFELFVIISYYKLYCYEQSHTTVYTINRTDRPCYIKPCKKRSELFSTDDWNMPENTLFYILPSKRSLTFTLSLLKIMILKLWSWTPWPTVFSVPSDLMLSLFSCVPWVFIDLLWPNVSSIPLLIFSLGCLMFYCWVLNALCIF